MSQPATHAFFGATGGCTLTALTHALNAGYHCSALARTPAKLTKLLTDKGITEDVLSKHLRIVHGNAKTEEDVKQALKNPDGSLIKMIISGVGAAPDLSNPFRPTLDDPTVCQDTVKTITTAMESLLATSDATAPYIVVISTTGTFKEDNDVPWLMKPLYHWLLAVPHLDKREMEVAAENGVRKGTFSNYTVIRPSLLIDTAYPYDKMRAGFAGRQAATEDRWNAFEGAAVGYSISRENVGRFIFEEIINKQGSSEWKDQKVTLTH